MPTRWRAVARAGLEPQEYADRIVGAWQELPRRLNASTTSSFARAMRATSGFVQDFLQRIYDNGDVYQDVYAGWYCVGCEEFKTEAELVDGKCSDHGTVPEWLEEKNWFFRLSATRTGSSSFTTSVPDFVLPHFRYNEARSFIAGGLRDFSISRATADVGRSDPVGSRSRSRTSGRRARSTTAAR
jgi:methionyl-tRNA synthetase